MDKHSIRCERFQHSMLRTKPCLSRATVFFSHATHGVTHCLLVLEIDRGGGATPCVLANDASLCTSRAIALDRCGPVTIIWVSRLRRGSMSAAFLTQSPGATVRDRQVASADSDPARLSRLLMVFRCCPSMRVSDSRTAPGSSERRGRGTPDRLICATAPCMFVLGSASGCLRNGEP